MLYSAERNKKGISLLFLLLCRKWPPNISHGDVKGQIRLGCAMVLSSQHGRTAVSLYCALFYTWVRCPFIRPLCTAAAALPRFLVLYKSQAEAAVAQEDFCIFRSEQITSLFPRKASYFHSESGYQPKVKINLTFQPQKNSLTHLWSS